MATGFLLFLKAFSWETNLWVKLGDFIVKKRKIWKKNVYLTENQLSRKEKKLSASPGTTLLKDQLFTSLRTRVHLWIEPLPKLVARRPPYQPYGLPTIVIGKDLAYEWVTSL